MVRNGTVYDPFLEHCLVELVEGVDADGLPADAQPDEPMTDEEARRALHEYEELEDTIREFEEERRWVVEKLQAWLEQQGTHKAKLEGRAGTRTVGLVKTPRRTVGHTRVLWVR